MFNLDDAKEISDEMIPLLEPIDYTNEIVEQIAKEQARFYDNFVCDKLSALGYTVEKLKNHKCSRVITGDSVYDENHHFFVDGQCILIINKKMTFDIDQMNPEMHNSKMELKVIGGI